MKITSTKKLRGVLDLPSVGIQIKYDHPADKSQTYTVDDKNYSNSDVQTAAGMKLITLKDIAEGADAYDEAEDLNNDVVEITNLSNHEIHIAAAERSIAPKSTVALPVAVLDNHDVQFAITKKILEVNKIKRYDFTKAPALDLDADIEDVKAKSDDTTATVANPNQEIIPHTEQSMKSHSANKTHSPNESTDDENAIKFVDKEQEEKRIKSHPILGKKVMVEADEEGEVIKPTKSEELEGTTPIIVKRASIEAKTDKKAIKKRVRSKTTKQTGQKKATKKKMISKKIKEEPDKEPTGEIFNLDV